MTKPHRRWLGLGEVILIWPKSSGKGKPPISRGPIHILDLDESFLSHGGYPQFSMGFRNHPAIGVPWLWKNNPKTSRKPGAQRLAVPVAKSPVVKLLLLGSWGRGESVFWSQNDGDEMGSWYGCVGGLKYFTGYAPTLPVEWNMMFVIPLDLGVTSHFQTLLAAVTVTC